MNGSVIAQAETRKVRVLVVDDNADAANSLGRLLSLLGKEVRVALNGESALQTLESFAADIVLLDLGMQGMDGFDTAKAIRGRPEFNQLTLVALTGWGQEQDRQKTEAAGFAAHLVKPVNIEQVEAVIAKSISRSRELAH